LPYKEGDAMVQVDYSLVQRKSPQQGMTMKKMVQAHLGPTSTGSSSSPDPSTLSPAESQRNYAITARLNAKNFMGMVKTRVVLPKDSPPNATGDDKNKAIEKAQAARSAEFFRQSAMPWGNVYMHTPTDAQRLNNPAQSAFVKQRQLSPPNTYGQFYAFMHAMAAAFGNLGPGQ
jgi:hypothetical protein